MRLALAATFAALGPILVAAPDARAEAPSPALMAKLAASAAGFDELGKKATFSMDTRIETLDGDGHVTGVETRSGRLVRQGASTHLVVLRATKDGRDCTEQARKDARDDEAKNGGSGDKKARVDIPFLASEQGRYAFDVVEVDPAHPSRVRIAFTPRQPDAHSVEGSAWVDRDAGQFLSAGVKLSRPGMFVDFVHVTLEVGATTEVGPALSRLTFEGKGGFLFLHKHVRGTVIFSDYKIAPP